MDKQQQLQMQKEQLDKEAEARQVEQVKQQLEWKKQAAERWQLLSQPGNATGQHLEQSEAGSVQQIRCTIGNCHYYAPGNRCTAGQILVTSQTMSKSLGNTFDAPVAARLQETPVSTESESCCHTFALKSSSAAWQDGITKLNP